MPGRSISYQGFFEEENADDPLSFFIGVRNATILTAVIYLGIVAVAFHNRLAAWAIGIF